MSGKFITLSVANLVTGGQYDYYARAYLPKKIKEFKADDPNTYITIFSVDQQNSFNVFKEQFKGKILFISKASVNGREHHGKFPRNTIVVYEPAAAAAPETLHVSSV
jgi:hypothetical protein